MEWIEIGGLSVAYERIGSGPALVLLHGVVGDGPATWRHQLDTLSDDLTVVAWDAPGMGCSDDPPDGFGMRDYVRCLAEFIAALGLGRPHLAGLSFGGTLALALYRQDPGLPRSLVLAGSLPGWAGTFSPETAQERLDALLALADRPGAAIADALLPSMFSPRAAPSVTSAFRASVAAAHPAGLRAMARALAETDLSDVLGAVALPMLLLYGEDDARAPVRAGEALHAAIPNSRLVVLRGAGHISSVEVSTCFTDELRAFLSSVPSP